MRNIARRLEYDGDEEFRRIYKLIKAGVTVFPSGLSRHFEIAKQKPDAFINHGKALAISIGGTNVKVMLASMKNGEMHAHYVRTMTIPERQTGFDEFFDDIILNDKIIFEYMSQYPSPVVGVSFPMAVIGDVAYHRTKVPTLDGVIARDFDRDAPTHNFRENFADYLRRRGLPEAGLVFQGDGIVAHHGAIALTKLESDDKSALIICGTGMATGDEENYIQIGIMELLDYDAELYPAAETENFQLHYATAGKGIFGLMNRAVILRARESGSLLAGHDLSGFFSESAHTKTVADIWESGLGKPLEGDALKIRELVGEDAFAELRELAETIMLRAARTIANALVATIVKMGHAANGKGHKLFFEGSICVNSHMLPLIERHIREMIRNARLFEEMGEQPPLEPELKLSPMEVQAADGADIRGVDITLIGTASMAFAHDIVKPL